MENKYKSWSGLRKQMNELLCDSLKNKISYFYTSYHEVHNAYGRATINYNKKEMVAFSWVEMYQQDLDNDDEEINKNKWMTECILCENDFLGAVTTYLNIDIKKALESDNYLLRVFAYMDRRVGRRTIMKIKDETLKLPEWVKQFYIIRCNEEGINIYE